MAASREGVVYNAIEVEILTTPATVIAKKISERVYSSERVVRTFIKRIEAVNPSINALVTKRFEVSVQPWILQGLCIANLYIYVAYVIYLSMVYGITQDYILLRIS